MPIDDALLRQLYDIEQIKRMKAEYGRLVDCLVLDPDPGLARKLASMFAEDAVLDFGSRLGIHMGRPAVQELFGHTLPTARSWTWHSFQNPFIEIMNDRAEARWVILAYAVVRNSPSSAPERVLGRYEDEYVRTEDGWRQSRLKFIQEGPIGCDLATLREDF